MDGTIYSKSIKKNRSDNVIEFDSAFYATKEVNGFAVFRQIYNYSGNGSKPEFIAWFAVREDAIDHASDLYRARLVELRIQDSKGVSRAG